MDLRSIITDSLTEIFDEEDLVAPEFVDDLVLLDTELDSLGYAVLVTRLEERLGYDPFSLMTEPMYPSTFGELTEIYDRFSSHARPGA